MRDWCYVLVLVLSLTACQQQPAPERTESPTVVERATVGATVEVEEPDAPGNGTLTGKVVSESTNEPLVGVTVRLAEVYTEGDSEAFVLDSAFSPGSVTDSNGQFAFNNVEARQYVVVIGNVERNNYEIIPNPEAPSEARVWTIPDGEILDIGELRVELSN